MPIRLKRNRVIVTSVICILLILLLIESRTTKDNVHLETNYDQTLRHGRSLMRYATYDTSPEMRRTQPGFMGRGVKVLPNEKEKEAEGYKSHSFNQLASDKISLERVLPDYRNQL